MTGVTEKLFMCQVFMCLLRPLHCLTNWRCVAVHLRQAVWVAPLRKCLLSSPELDVSIFKKLSGPHQPVKCYSIFASPPRPLYCPSAIESVIGMPHLALSRTHTGGSPQPPHPKLLRGLNRAIVVLCFLKPLLKQARNRNAIEAAIFNHVLDRY